MITWSMIKARIYNGAEITSTISVGGKTEQLYVRVKWEQSPTSYTKINSKMDLRPKCKARYYKTLRGKQAENSLT